MKIRKAGGKDVSILGQMNHRLIRDEGHPNPMNVVQLAGRMRRWLKGKYRAYLFEKDEKVAGYCVFREEKDYLYIRQFYIEPAFRRKGMGKKSFEWLRKRLWRNHKVLRLDVLVGNTRGCSFWKALGFKTRVLGMERKDK